MAKDKLQDIPDNTNIVVIGAPKCGQNSLKKYLQKRFPDVKVERVEIIWHPEHGKTVMETAYKGYQPILICRNPVDRIWSGYYYFGADQKMTLEEYLQLKNRKGFGNIGESSPIKQGDFKYWLKFYEKYNPIMVWLEDCEKLEGFPHENKGSQYRHREYPKINAEKRKLIEVALHG